MKIVLDLVDRGSKDFNVISFNTKNQSSKKLTFNFLAFLLKKNGKEQVTQEDLTLFALIALTKPTIYCGFPLSYYYGNVGGQATSRIKGSYVRYIDTSIKFNLTYKLWNLRGRDNKIFKIFLKYELRHYIIHALRLNDFNLIKVILENIDGDILNLFPFFEIKVYRMPSLKIWNKFYIYVTKLLWRMRGFPRIKK